MMYLLQAFTWFQETDYLNQGNTILHLTGKTGKAWL